MKRILFSMLTVCVATTAGIACNCGGMSIPAGGACTTDTECEPGLTCQTQLCEPTDGGFVPPGQGTDAGTTGNDGGTTPGKDAGVIPGPDGGCDNLACRQVTCSTPGTTTTLTGKVYDPSGQLPLYNAIVYVPNGQVQPFPKGVSCDRCGSSISGSPLVIALTGPDGKFTLENVPTGADVPLVIQLGKWRRQVTIPNVPACQTTPITDVNTTRLPRNRYEGDIPQMAIATGSADPMECLLLKMGIDPVEFSLPGAADAGSITMYRANGTTTTPQQPAASTLWSDAGTLAKYDVVLLPCEGGENRKPDAGLQNAINYANAGGRLFVTHYSYVWTAFPQPFAQAADWAPDKNQDHNPPNPFGTSVDQSFPKGQAFFEWLGNVNALNPDDSLPVYESRHDVNAVDAGSTRWLHAFNPDAGRESVQHLTFNTPVNPDPLPDGDAGVQCGRVVFSDFHVTTAALDGGTKFPQNCVVNTGFTAQEKALVFMLFDVSSCVQSDTTAPTACPANGQACSANTACCSGLACLNTGGSLCSASDSNCSCHVVIQ